MIAACMKLLDYYYNQTHYNNNYNKQKNDISEVKNEMAVKKNEFFGEFDNGIDNNEDIKDDVKVEDVKDDKNEDDSDEDESLVSEVSDSSENYTDYYSEEVSKISENPHANDILESYKAIKLGNMIIDSTGITFPDGSKMTSASLIKGPITGFVCGTEILTSKGYKKIEALNKGDKVITVGNIYKNQNLEMKRLHEFTILWISKIKINVLEKGTLPICIKKNTFGKNKPYKNIYLSPDTSIYIYGKKNTAKMINKNQNNDTIKESKSKIPDLILQDNSYTNKDLYYYHLELESHQAIMVNGLISDSFLDIGGIRDYFV